ncbi:LysR family transcriptional regulator [Pectobacterium brasiliense]|uniref:LysR family transcriptional regulator n=1 Tax=Pectobacterium brasiliense TaxID=180957 RepID=UPI0004E671FB|nr:LysR family transcriptional regulator [Pectobacterium brasiliense]KFF61312.1 LysR family transcriptional regulator [Pectobacterium brasiliense]GLY61101.1 transcriptional regulator [Pectobacterium carotovorum subsp. carotovorum]
MVLLNDIALFVEVVKARSFRGAAEILGMPNSTLSRRISQLEKAIGLRLMHRTTRKMELTEAGLIYYDRCRRIIDEARLAHEQLGNMLVQPSGLLRVSLSVDFASVFLAPVIAEFCARYPGIRFEFDYTPRQVDLVSEPFDVAIRLGEPADSGLIARKLARLNRYLFASPEYLRKHGEPAHPEELILHECLPMSTDNSPCWELFRGEEFVKVTLQGKFLMNSVGMIKRFATLNLGVGLLSAELVRDEVNKGELVQILPQWRASAVSVYAITETRLLPAKTQCFIDFIKEKMS